MPDLDVFIEGTFCGARDEIMMAIQQENGDAEGMFLNASKDITSVWSEIRLVKETEKHLPGTDGGRKTICDHLDGRKD